MNYEGALRGRNCISKRGPVLVQSWESIEVLKRLNVVGVALAKNHSMDYGANGLDAMLKALGSSGIKHTGAGSCLDVAMQSMVFEYDSKKVVSFSNGWNVEETFHATDCRAGCAPREQNLMLQALTQARANYGESALIVNCMHWVFEFNRFPMPYDMDLAHSLIDASSDLIVGHYLHDV